MARRQGLLPSCSGLFLLLAACGGGGGSGGGDVGAGPVVSPGPITQPPGPNPNPPPSNGSNATEVAANYGIRQIGADAAYNAGARGNGVSVAVIDSGISLDHPEFAGRIDRVNSIDIVTGSTATLDDRSGHGSHVAGIIAANADGKGMRGVAPSASLMAIRADLRDTAICPTPGCGYFDDDVATALSYASSKGADIINLSIGKDSPINGAYRAALEAAIRGGALVVVAAGNSRSDQPLLPAGLADEPGLRGGMLVVGAVDRNGAIYSQNNKAGAAEPFFLVAPGVDIYSAFRDGGYRRLTGTSMAAPHIAGAAAVLKSQFPSLSMQQVAEILIATADDLGAAGPDQVYGNGLVNLRRALQPVGRPQVATGATVDGPSFDALTTSLSLGPAFGDALRGQSALAGGMVLDAYGRPYRTDFSKSIQRRRGTVDMGERLRDASLRRDVPLDALAPLGLTGGVRLSEPRDRPMPGTMRAALDSAADPHAQELEELRLEAPDTPFGSLRLGFGLQPSGMSAGQIDTAARGLFLDAGTLLAPVDQMLAAGTGASLRFALTETTGVMIGVLDSDDGGSRERSAAEQSGRLLTLGASQRLGAATSLQLDYAYVEESAGLLGTSADGAFAFGAGAKSHLSTARLAYQATDRIELFAQATAGISSLESGEGLLRDWGTVRSDAFAVGVVASGVLDEADRLGLVLGQPLRVSSASALLDLPTARTLDGRVERSQERVSVEPEGRELRLELAYQRPLDAKRVVGAWLLLQHEPGHAADADPALGLGLRYTSRF